MQVSKEIRARLVPDPAGRVGHWHDPLRDDVYAFGDIHPRGGKVVLPAQSDEDDDDDTQTGETPEIDEVADLKAQLAKLLLEKELNALTVDDLRARVVANGKAQADAITRTVKSDLIALLME